VNLRNFFIFRPEYISGLTAEWKGEISKKLEGLSELSELRKDVQRIAVALEKLAGIEGQDSNKELLSWPESEGKMIEVQGSKKKESRGRRG